MHRGQKKAPELLPGLSLPSIATKLVRRNELTLGARRRHHAACSRPRCAEMSSAPQIVWRLCLTRNANPVTCSGECGAERLAPSRKIGKYLALVRRPAEHGFITVVVAH